MNWLYLGGFAIGLILFGRWLRQPDSRALRMTGGIGSGPSPRHPAARALAPPPVELTSREEVVWEAIERQYGTPLERLVPRQHNGEDPHWDRIRDDILPGDARDFTEGDK